MYSLIFPPKVVAFNDPCPKHHQHVGLATWGGCWCLWWKLQKVWTFWKSKLNHKFGRIWTSKNRIRLEFFTPTKKNGGKIWSMESFPLFQQLKITTCISIVEGVDRLLFLKRPVYWPWRFGPQKGNFIFHWSSGIMLVLGKVTSMEIWFQPKKTLPNRPPPTNLHWEDWTIWKVERMKGQPIIPTSH